MIVTEEQARELWCPQSRVPFLGAHVGNRVSSAMLKMCEKSAAQGDSRDLDYVRQQIADTKCVASACMFWRRADPAKHGPCDPDGGYCGVAGEP
jgi:hypothetical protein